MLETEGVIKWDEMKDDLDSKIRSYVQRQIAAANVDDDAGTCEGKAAFIHS